MPLADVLAVVPPGSPEDVLIRQVDFTRLPRHIAIIMDGNGRWAESRRLPRVEGHRAGIDAVRDSVETSARLGVSVLTLYAFSVENWKRPDTEISALMGLLKHYLRAELKSLLKNNIRFKVIGQPERLSPDIREELSRAETRTASNTGMQFNIALPTAAAPKLWMPRGARSRAASVPTRSTKQRSHHSFIRPASQTPISSFERAAKCGSAISCSGRSRTRKFGSPRHCGRIFARRICSKRSSTIKNAIAATVPSPPNRSPRRRADDRVSISRLISAAVLVVGVGGTLIWLPPWATLALAAVAAAAGGVELSRLARPMGATVSPAFTALAAAAFCALLSTKPPAEALHRDLIVALLIGVTIGAGLITLASTTPGPGTYVSIAVLLLAPLYVGLPLGTMAWMREAKGAPTLIWLIGVVSLSDTAQYYAGTLWGRRKLAPIVSPAKPLKRDRRVHRRADCRRADRTLGDARTRDGRDGRAGCRPHAVRHGGRSVRVVAQA
jgi:undecaprenyl diphosphate synthase